MVFKLFGHTDFNMLKPIIQTKYLLAKIYCFGLKLILRGCKIKMMAGSKNNLSIEHPLKSIFQ